MCLEGFDSIARASLTPSRTAYTYHSTGIFLNSVRRFIAFPGNGSADQLRDMTRPYVIV